MVLATSELEKIAKTFKNINLDDIRGSSIDLAISEKAKIPKENKTIDLFSEKPNTDELFNEVELAKGYELKPNSFLYSSTVEYIKIPQNMCGIIYQEAHLQELGLYYQVACMLIQDMKDIYL